MTNFISIVEALYKKEIDVYYTNDNDWLVQIKDQDFISKRIEVITFHPFILVSEKDFEIANAILDVAYKNKVVSDLVVLDPPFMRVNDVPYELTYGQQQFIRGGLDLSCATKYSSATPSLFATKEEKPTVTAFEDMLCIL